MWLYPNGNFKTGQQNCILRVTSSFPLLERVDIVSDSNIDVWNMGFGQFTPKTYETYEKKFLMIKTIPKSFDTEGISYSGKTSPVSSFYGIEEHFNCKILSLVTEECLWCLHWPCLCTYSVYKGWEMLALY